MSEEIERLNYYQLQFLGAEDFKAEQVYHRDMRRRHNLGPHTWGIVTGLELKEEPRAGSSTDFDVYVQPGLAIDGFGREIVVGALHKLDASDFQFIKGKTTSIHTVHIAHAEEQSMPPAFGYAACDGDGQNDRVRELFRIVIDADQPTHAPIRIDGRDNTGSNPNDPLPRDLSVPHQELPDNASTRWLVPLGSVQWNPLNTAFAKDAATDDLLKKDRVYAGIIAAHVLSPSDTLLLRPRVPVDPPPSVEPDFAEVQGRLQVDGSVVAEKDIIVHGGRVSLQMVGGSEGGVPLWLSRISGAGGVEHDLRIHIGPDTTGPDLQKQRLTIGPGSNESNPTAATEKVVLAVKADDTVDIETGTLSFGAPPRQMINLSTKDYGIGVVATSLYQRSPADFDWYRGGAHASGTLAMRLNASSVLTVFGPLQAKSLQATSGDVLIDGGKLQLRGVNGTTGSDDLALTRFQAAANSNELRVIIGDDLDGTDAFTIGPVWWSDGQYKEQFKVTNDGHVTAAGSLSVLDGVGGTPKFKVTNLGDVTAAGSLTVQKATMSGLLTASGGLTVTGNTQLQSLEVSGQVNTSGGDLTVGGNIVLTAPHAITYGTARCPFDVVAGETQTAFGPGTYTTSLFTVQSGLPQITNASIHVALAATKGSAANGQWSVTVNQLSIAIQLNAVKFALDLKIAAGCSIDAVSYLVIFTP